MGPHDQHTIFHVVVIILALIILYYVYKNHQALSALTSPTRLLPINTQNNMRRY